MRLLCGYATATQYLMEHSSAEFDIDNVENSIVTLYCY